MCLESVIDDDSRVKCIYGVLCLITILRYLMRNVESWVLALIPVPRHGTLSVGRVSYLC